MYYIPNVRARLEPLYDIDKKGLFWKSLLENLFYFLQTSTHYMYSAPMINSMM